MPIFPQNEISLFLDLPVLFEYFLFVRRRGAVDIHIFRPRYFARINQEALQSSIAAILELSTLCTGFTSRDI